MDTGLYQPEKPSRIIDTRPSSNIGSHGTLAATGFVLYNTGRVVTAVAATVTAVAAVLGYWSVYSSQVPATSSLNVNAPGATPNLTITASGGAVIYSQSGGDVLVDVTGVFV